MASLTVRQLDERLKKLLRLRAARSGRSVEDEVRTHPEGGGRGDRARRAGDDRPAGAEIAARRGDRARHQARAADHRRRHRRLQIARSDPPPERARLRRALRAHQGGRAFRHVAVGRRAGWRARVHRSVRSGRRIRRRSYSSGARDRPDRGRAGHRRPDGENGARPRQRSSHRGAARGRHQDSAGAGA